MTQREGLIRYAWFDQVPDNLKTKTQLGKMGLKPGGEPVAYIYWRRRDITYYLYEVTQAVPKRQITEAQQAALVKAQEAQRIKRQTCEHCGGIDERTDHVLEWIVTDRSEFAVKGIRLCPECHRIYDAIDVTEEQIGFAADAAEAVEHARTLLERPADSWCILDTETTGLYDASVVQVAVLAPTGEVLLDTLVKPPEPIPADATRIHHITDDMVADAPTFAEIYPRLAEVIRGKRLVIYNVAFDWPLLEAECVRAELPLLQPKDRCCAMEWYAPYAGEWSEYFGDYKWQPLYGDHSALGDCQAVLRRLMRVADDQGALDHLETLKRQLAELQAQWEARKQCS
jgi:hypothetical protein